MKKINLKEIEANLTKYELNKIMAGSSSGDNINAITECTCFYKNHGSSLTNSNQVFPCACWCS